MAGLLFSIVSGLFYIIELTTNKLKYGRRNTFLFYLGWIFYGIIKFDLRQIELLNKNEFVKFLLGSGPNLAAGFALSFIGFTIFGKTLTSERAINLQKTLYNNSHKKYNRIVQDYCLMTAGILIGNELLQNLNFMNRVFDIWDVVFSLIGILIAWKTMRIDQCKKNG